MCGAERSRASPHLQGFGCVVFQNVRVAAATSVRVSVSPEDQEDFNYFFQPFCATLQAAATGWQAAHVFRLLFVHATTRLKQT